MIYAKENGYSRRTSRDAFTLVEIITVIAIIAVLGTIALPAFQRVRESANQIKCASNMRQIGQAMALFAQDNSGQFPLTTHTVMNVEESWIYTLAIYLEDVDEVRICPADPRGDERLKANLTSYVLNEYIAVPNRDPFGQLRDEDFTNLQRLENPSRTMTAFIASDRLALGDHSDHTHSRGWNTWGRVVSDIQPNRFGGDGTSGGTAGRANYLFADGHIGSIKAKEIQAKIEAGVNPAKPTQL